MSPRALVVLFKVAAVAEALSWLGLLVGMYFKHVAGTTELGVEIFGPIHGVVFLAYVALVVLVARALRWSWWVALLGLASAVPPFATVAFELWVARTGRLEVPEVESASTTGVPVAVER